MSQPLQSLVYKTLGLGQGKVFSVELPESNDTSVANRIDDYCRELSRPCLVVNGKTVNKKNLLSGLQNLFSMKNKSAAFNTSTLRSITQIFRNHRTGVLCVNGAELMNQEAEQLIAQLVHYARKHKLTWKFYFLSKRSSEATELNSSFGVQKSLMWSARQGDWFFVEKADISDNDVDKPRPLWMNKWLIAVVVCIGLYLYLASQPKPKYIRNMNTSLPQQQPLMMSDLSFQNDNVNGDLSVILPASILNSVIQGDLESFKRLSKQNEGVLNGVNEQGENVLIIAVMAQNDTIVDEVLTSSINVNHTDPHGRTALFYAANTGQTSLVKKLLSAGSDINQQSQLFKTPLMAAVHNNHVDVAMLLIESGAKTELPDHSGWTAMFYAVWNGHIELVDLLLANGASLKVLDKSGNDLKQVAQMNGSDEFLTAFNKRGL